MKESVVFPVIGGVAGASLYSSLGGVGIIGGFGGIGIGLAGMTAVGTVTGSALYGAVSGIREGDSTAFVAMSLGAIGGMGTSATIGGVGVSFGSSAFGLGMGSMAAMGGVFGLGIYGLAKMFSSNVRSEPIAQTFSRMEEKISYQEAYYQALVELSPTLAELSWRHKFIDLEVEAELAELKNKLQQENASDSGEQHRPNDFDNFNSESNSTDIETENKFTWQSLKILKGHTATVNSIAIENNIIVSGSDDQTVNLWDLSTGKLIFSFFEPSEVYQVAINSTKVIASNHRRQITSWKLSDKTLHHSFFSKSYDPFLRNSYNQNSHDGLIQALVLSKDGKTLFSGSADNTIKIWNANTGQLKSTLVGHTDAVLSLAVDSDRNILFSGSADKSIRIWNLKDLSSTPEMINLSSCVATLVLVQMAGI